MLIEIVILKSGAMAKTLSFNGVYLAGKPTGTLWDVNCADGNIVSIEEHLGIPDAIEDGRFLSPSLCHPHIHLDKCFLLSHPKYADLEIEIGDFAEAMKLTSRSMIHLSYPAFQTFIEHMGSILAINPTWATWASNSHGQ